MNPHSTGLFLMYQSNCQDLNCLNISTSCNITLPQHYLQPFSCGGQSGAWCSPKPSCESREAALTLSLCQWAQNSSRPSFNYCPPPSKSSQCQTVSLVMKTNVPYRPDLSAQTAGVQRKEGIWECVYGVHGGCMWGYVAGVTFLHQLLLISPHSLHLKFHSRRDVVGFRGRSEGVFLCVSLTRDRYSKHTYYLQHKSNSKPLGRTRPGSGSL